MGVNDVSQHWHRWADDLAEDEYAKRFPVDSGVRMCAKDLRRVAYEAWHPVSELPQSTPTVLWRPAKPDQELNAREADEPEPPTDLEFVSARWIGAWPYNHGEWADPRQVVLMPPEGEGG